MRNLHNTLISLLNSGKFYTLFSALASASLLVCTSETAFSDPVPEGATVIPTGPFSDGSVVTNITFASFSDLASYISSVSDYAEAIRYSIYSITNGTASIRAIAVIINDNAISIANTTDDADIQFKASTIANRTNSQSPLGIPARTRAIDASAQSIDNTVGHIVEDVDSVSIYNANVALSTVGGDVSGCICPDYTSILNQLLTALQSIQGNVSSLVSTVGTMSADLSSISGDTSLMSRQLDSILGILADFDPYLSDTSDSLLVIQSDFAAFYSLWLNSFWPLFQRLYTQVDMLRADVELFYIDVTNRMLSPVTAFFYDRWLCNARGGVGLTYSPLNNFGSFFGESNVDPTGGWGEDYVSFREFFEYEYLSPQLVALGMYTPDWLLHEDRASVFITPLHTVFSNLYETARPDAVLSRGLLYDLWAEGLDDDVNIPGMPTGREVSQQPMADAMIGLLYRIQYLLSLGYKPVESNTLHSVLEEVPPGVKNAAQDLLNSEFISPSTTNVPFLRVYSSMKTALETFKQKFSGIEIADTWLVLSEDGFTLEFTGSSGDPLISGSDRPIYITQPDFEGSHSAFFINAIGKFMGVVWYGIFGLVALAVTGFVFRFFWIATTFTIAVIGGDFSEAVEQFGNIGKALAGGGD